MDVTGDGDSDGFLDDDLDALISEDFLELQQRALRSTQHQRQPPKDPDLHSLPSTASVPLRPKVVAAVGNLPVQPQADSFTDNPSSDYGDLDDEVLDAGLIDSPKNLLAGKPSTNLIPGLVGTSTQREQWRQQRFSVPQQLQGNGLRPVEYPVRPSPRIAHHGQNYNSSGEEDELLDNVNVESDAAACADGQGSDLRALEAKVAELLRERASLQQAIQTANDQVHAKAGEISIVRANQAKALKDHERHLQELSKQHADLTAKQRAEIEQAKAEREKLLTEKKYLQHDLLEESERAKKLKRVAKGGNAAPNARNTVTTPKKTKAASFRDGFDDDEIMISPANTPSRSKPDTPTAALKKRKWRPPEDSPSQPLRLTQAHEGTLPDAPDLPEGQVNSVIEKHRVGKPDTRFQFTQKVLHHRVKANGKRSLEALADYGFPSQPETKLSTLLLDKLALLSADQSPADFSASMGSIVITLWSQCIDEEYYKPLHLLLDLVKFILHSSRPGTGAHLMDEVVGLAQKTADINVIPRFRRFAPATASSPKTALKTNNEIDTNDCLQILYLVALACAHRQEDITRFWRLMRFDFIMMICRNSQPVEDVRFMLKLLSSSVQRNTFAMITDPAKQTELEQHVIERVTAMLIESPKSADGDEPYDTVEIAVMRQQILSLMEKLCDKRHGGEALAKHPLAIGRLVRVMNDELNNLYDHKAGHEHRATLVNQATRLLFHLTSAYSGLINMQEKLRAHPGGVYKHLIALTRLAFSDGVFYEQGVEDDVVDSAHQMLEDTVTPEEGEALLEVFSSAKK